MIERFQSIISLAAGTAATGLNVLSHSLVPFPEETPYNGMPVPLGRALGGLVLGKAEAMIRREVSFGVVPDLGRALQIVANRTPVNVVSPEEAVARWNRISVAPQDLWVDIGSGNGDSLGRLARRHKAQFIGVDVENSTELGFELSTQSRCLARLPQNVRYLVLSYNRPGLGPVSHERLEQVSMMGRWNDRTSTADRLAAATVETVGAGKASVVSFIFPYLHYRRSSLAGRVFHGPLPRPMDFQMRTAVELLRPGGLGVVLLEAGRQADQSPLVHELLSSLRAQEKISSIEMASQPVDVKRFGIASYAPRNKHGKPASIEEFPVAQAFFFQRKG